MQPKPFITILAIGLTAAGALLCGCSPKVGNSKRPMSRGEKLYRANCGSCHRLLAPEEHDAPTWEAYIEKYGKRLSADPDGETHLIGLTQFYFLPYELFTYVRLGIAGEFADTEGTEYDYDGVEVATGFGMAFPREIRFDALGLGQVASETLRFRRGGAEAGLVLSSYGRVRRW